MAQHHTFLHITKPLRYLTILTGVGYFDHSEEKDSWWQVAEIAYTTLYSIIFVVVSWYGSENLKAYQVSLRIDSANFIIPYGWNVILSVLIIIAVRVNGKKIREAIALLDGSDQRMENMGMSMQRWQHHKQQLKLIAICCLIVTVFAIVSYNCQLPETIPLHMKLFLGFAMTLPAFLTLSYDVYFLFCVNYLRTKFHNLNNLLRAMLPTTTESTSAKGISKMIHDVEEKTLGKDGVHVVNGNANTMRAVKQIHLQLVKISRIVNDFFGVQLLLTMCTTFVFLTLLLFLAYRTIFSGIFDEQYLCHVTELFLSILFYLSKLFILTQVCNRTCDEASETGELISQLYEPSTSKEFRAEIRDFSMQMIQNPLVFTACGFFYLDHSFIHGVVGTVSTYIVILIQVSQIDVSHKTQNETALASATTEPNFKK